MSKGLRKGDRGTEVNALQVALHKQGYQLKPDGHFGFSTDQAVRAYQHHMGLLPDGIAGPKTLGALGVRAKGPASSFNVHHLNDLILRIGPFIGNALMTSRHYLMPMLTSFSPHVHGISADGLRFIFTQETVPGVSNKLHWPEGASGVTLGPGYDMKERTKEEVISDLTAIGVDSATAKKASEGVGKTGSADAGKFREDNKNLINLTNQQEMRLLIRIVPKYEAIVKKHIRVDLLQREYDALTCFAYNPGYKFTTVSDLINAGHVADAMIEIQKRVKSGGVVLKELVRRRQAEVSLYVGGHYGSLRYKEEIPKC